MAPNKIFWYTFTDAEHTICFIFSLGTNPPTPWKMTANHFHGRLQEGKHTAIWEPTINPKDNEGFLGTQTVRTEGFLFPHRKGIRWP